MRKPWPARRTADAPGGQASRRRAWSVWAVLAILLTLPFALPFLDSPVASAVPNAFVPTLVALVDAARSSPPIPDAAGLAYEPDSERLLVTDPGVDATAVFQDVNVWETTLAGRVRDVGGTSPFSDEEEEEPTGIAFDPSSGHAFVTDARVQTVSEISPGPDGRLWTVDDQLSGFATDAFGSHDPQGISFDTLRGHLYLSDGENAEIYELDPGANGIFDGVPPEGDDQASSFSTEPLGVFAPSGVEYNADDDTLFIVGDGDDFVLETTRDGLRLRRLDVGGLEAVSLSGITYAPASDDADVQHLYLADRGLRAESDGRVYEVTLEMEPGLVSVRVDGSENDAEESASGSVSRSSPSLELVLDQDAQTVGVRFTQVAIPRGAPILEANLQFVAARESSIASALIIEGENTGDAAPFRPRVHDLSERTRTGAAVSWSPPAWTAPGAVGPAERTPDLSEIVQEIVDRPDWSSGNSLALLVTGAGQRVAHAYDQDAGSAAFLHVRYAPSSCGNGVKELGERCDGSDLGSLSCT
ncbi:MAG: hypothetical protein ABFS46_06495, partial [Myxococcota bacterium]